MIERLRFGTKNEAKIDPIRGVLSPAGIVIEGVSNLDHLPEVVEDGKTAVENARKKALVYAGYLQEPVFSMDNALYLTGLREEYQPGLYVRRIPGYSEHTTDEDLITYYARLIAHVGNVVPGHWDFGMCIATPSGAYQETTISSQRTFVSTPCSAREKGYPLESLQIDHRTGKYLAELTHEEKYAFWRETVGEPLLAFVRSTSF